MGDLTALWDFDDPAASEQRFRERAAEVDPPERHLLLTQVARALGLQERFDEGQALLDELEGHDAEGVDAEVRCRIELERGRLLRSAGQPAAAAPHFLAAATLAEAAGLEALHVDALHMVALVVPVEEQPTRTREALAVARAATDEAARNWDASLLNNLGMVHADAGDFAEALSCFEDALAARERIGDDGRTRVARWMVAWALRHLGRRDEALALQVALREELAAVGEEDPYVDEELALLSGGGTPGR